MGTMAANFERLCETLQQEVGMLHANLQGLESRIELLERRSEQALQGPAFQALLQHSPHCATEAAAEPFRFISAPQICHPALVSSPRVVSAQPQCAGSPPLSSRRR